VRLWHRQAHAVFFDVSEWAAVETSQSAKFFEQALSNFNSILTFDANP